MVSVAASAVSIQSISGASRRTGGIVVGSSVAVANVSMGQLVTASILANAASNSSQGLRARLNAGLSAAGSSLVVAAVGLTDGKVTGVVWDRRTAGETSDDTWPIVIGASVGTCIAGAAYYFLLAGQESTATPAAPASELSTVVHTGTKCHLEI